MSIACVSLSGYDLSRGVIPFVFCFNLPKKSLVYPAFCGDYDKYPLIIPQANDTMKIIDDIVRCCGVQRTVVNVNTGSEYGVQEKARDSSVNF